MDIKELYAVYLQHPVAETDTRKIKKGSLFFALKGPNFNGNHYAQQALDAGAAYCIVDEISGKENDKFILVNDSLKALQDLAAYHREQLTIPFIGITGSNGKTTTKELIHAVLSARYKTSTTEGNLNNHIGVPLTLLRIPQNAEMAVVEMGANHIGEIAGYCIYANPTHGLITNTGKAHIEGFGSEEGVRIAKGELYRHIKNNNGTAFVYTGQEHLIKLAEGISNMITYGTADAQHTGNAVASQGFLKVKMNDGLEINTKLVGGYNLPNVLAAVAVGRTFDVPDETIKKALEDYTPSNSRSQLLEVNSNKIIMDAYNANPSSMKAAIENFAAMESDKKVLILGGMMELGEGSIADHTEIVELINKYKWDEVVLVGKDYTALPSYIQHFSSSTEVRDWYRNRNFQNTSILIKGSRGMQMEKVIE